MNNLGSYVDLCLFGRKEVMSQSIIIEASIAPAIS